MKKRIMDPLQCALCFVTLDENKRENTCCANPNCSSKICIDCLEHLIQYSVNNSVLPCCPVQTCKEIYFYTDIQRSNMSIATQYKKACFDFFLKSDGDAIRQDILEQEIIDKIRAEKLQFLENSFPPAVGLVARISFKHKLHKISQSKKELVHLKVKNNKKRCFYQACTGFLDDNINNVTNGIGNNGEILICLLCETQFCKRCEKELDSSHNKKHECNEDDVRSLNLVHGMTRCPGCNLPVFKDVGCDFITCSSCSVSFHYKTGERTRHGSVNARIQLAPEERLLSAIYRKELPESCLELMLLIESFKPPVVPKHIILRPIHRSIKTSDSQRFERDLVIALEKYTRYKYNSKRYSQVIRNIEKHLSKIFSSIHLNQDDLVCDLDLFLKDALDEISSEK